MASHNANTTSGLRYIPNPFMYNPTTYRWDPGPDLMGHHNVSDGTGEIQEVEEDDDPEAEDLIEENEVPVDRKGQVIHLGAFLENANATVYVRVIDIDYENATLRCHTQSSSGIETFTTVSFREIGKSHLIFSEYLPIWALSLVGDSINNTTGKSKLGKEQLKVSGYQGD